VTLDAKTSSGAPTAASGPLVLADISGYTAFLQSVAFAHRDDAFADGAVPDAYAILTRLLDGFILHAGPFVLQEIAGQRELVGPEVVIAHRLLKSSAPELAGRSGFALVTSAAAEQLAIPLDDCAPIVESHEHYAPIDAHVFTLSA